LLSKINKIVIIDNKSTDTTILRAKESIQKLGFEKRVQVIRNSENYGLGGSQKVALLLGHREQYDYVAILHGDNQAVTAELLNLIMQAEDYPNKSSILGARFMPQSKLDGYSYTRTFGNITLNIL